MGKVFYKFRGVGWPCLAAGCPPSRSFTPVREHSRSGGENRMKKLMGWDKDRESLSSCHHEQSRCNMGKATLKVPHSSLGRSGCSITPLQQNPFLFWGLCSFLEIEAVAQLQSTPVLQNRCPKGSVICIQHMLVYFPQKIWI